LITSFWTVMELASSALLRTLRGCRWHKHRARHSITDFRKENNM
jgi:hypothetical protein